MILGGSARLAWFDVLDIKIPIIQAETPSCTWVDVPVSYFLSHSYTFSHGYIDSAPAQGHYPPSIWGSVPEFKRAITSGQCPEPSRVKEPEPPQARQADA